VTGGAASHRSQGAVSPLTQTGALVRTPCTSEVVLTKDDHDDDDERCQEKVFWMWWVETFPLHNGGAQTSMPWATARPIIAELLQHRDVTRLQSMALAMWSSSTGWIATSDRSLRVLRQAADTLDQAVARAQRAPTQPSCHYKHDPPCRSMTECVQVERDRVAAEDADDVAQEARA
jgi:hypothetical protein